MAEPPKKKHVIILGAGASFTSGYPIADRLRLLMSSERELREELSRVGNGNKEYLDKIIEHVLAGPMKPTIELFRHGGFATVDEFSRLAYQKLPKQVQDLKRLVRFALSLRNPEDQFHKSDYYAFIQRLFQNSLFPLRNDISILTFNYDPYLPYLLEKAYMVRCHAVGSQEDITVRNAVTSGFYANQLGALEDGDCMCVLQLHGSIAWPIRSDSQKIVAYADLFTTELSNDGRIQMLSVEEPAMTAPPIVFPVIRQPPAIS